MSSRDVLKPCQFLPFKIPKQSINLSITSTTAMSTNPPRQKAPKEVPTPAQTLTKKSSSSMVSRNISPIPPSTLMTKDPSHIALQIYHSLSITKLQSVREEIQRAYHGEGGQRYLKAIDHSLGNWKSLDYATGIFRASKLQCNKCGLIHEEELKASLGEELFEAQYAALMKSNARLAEVGNSKMPQIGEWIEVLEGFVKKLKDCPPGRC